MKNMKHAIDVRANVIPNVIDVFLQPGEYFVGDASHRVRTLLGSCVSIMLWHPRLQIGAMSHFLLGSSGRGPGTELDARYGEDAMCLMLQELECSKVVLTECHGKIFGGANMFPGQVRSTAACVGTKNGKLARALLQSHAIPVVSESLFGVGHRQILFDISNGDVWSRQIAPVFAAPVFADQQKEKIGYEKCQSPGGR
jgi:chemotaxis protein CheD